MNDSDVLQTSVLPPQPPLPPEIEGHLKKLKRKTSNLSGSWNRRWFFVDPKRLEFGYAKSKAPNAPRSSIYLNDITAVVQFDDTHFQVESRTRNFFLCGESKASTVCWVRSLDDYRRKRVEYEKEVALLAAAIPSLSSDRVGEFADASSLTSKKSKSKRSTDDVNTAGRDVSQTSSASSSNPAHDSSRESFEVDKSMTTSTASAAARGRSKGDRKAHHDRSPSPTEGVRRESHRTRSSMTTASSPSSSNSARKSRSGKGSKEGDLDDGGGSSSRATDRRESRSRHGRRSQERHDREHDDGDDYRSNDSGSSHSSSSSSRRGDRSRDRSTSRHRRATTGGSGGVGASSTSTSASATSTSRHKTRASYASTSHQGYVMEAWVDDFD